ncbi:DUF2637 domain-containing protein [Streptomyces gilvus]|uniref:DUF2637 domain-containing protein n=1 Tax=Streptomyces gilvus TaxID=2920937 RepID=UPI001F0F139D|nr:DUF2637 domain-containing protein [Streptomyces sp. CME 23]MCH5671524.1 DUF2637 domain-containing protein [Streptomyces sp. CME 23]
MNSSLHVPRSEAEWASVNPGDLHVPEHWDPAEELAQLLRSGGTGEWAGPYLDAGRLLSETATASAAVASTVPHRPSRHRRVQGRQGGLSWSRTTSFLVAAVASVIVAMVSVFGGMVAYHPLSEVAIGDPARSGVDSWWPLLIYGPWMVASLSILRAALHRRRAAHSWCAVTFFSAVAVALCVVDAPKTFPHAATAALPAIAALTCFHQLVRQITLTRPPRKGTPRHRDYSSARNSVGQP